MRLVASSNPDDADRYQPLDLLGTGEKRGQCNFKRCSFEGTLALLASAADLKENKMNSWHKQYIYDYWDSKTGAIAVFSGALREPIEEEEKKKITESISKAVEGGVSKLSDRDLMLMSVTMIDDLYKAGDAAEIWDGALEQYIAASAGTFSRAIAARGYLIHYLVDNSFENSDFGMQRPLELYPVWFRAAGFAYLCPQLFALRLMENDGISRPDYIATLPRYIREARHVTHQAIEQCHSEKRHYVYLDTDSVDGTFDKAMALKGSQGIITICRNGAPATESKLVVTFPEDPLPS